MADLKITYPENEPEEFPQPEPCPYFPDIRRPEVFPFPELPPKEAGVSSFLTGKKC